MKKVKMTIAIILMLLAAVIAIQNTAQVKTQLLMWSIELPRIILLVAVFIFGFVAGKLIKLRKK